MEQEGASYPLRSAGLDCRTDRRRWRQRVLAVGAVPGQLERDAAAFEVGQAAA